MPTFEFPLQAALDLRRREEEAALQRYAQARGQMEAIRGELEAARCRHQRLTASMRHPGSAGEQLRLHELEHTGRCLSDLRRNIADLRRRLTEAEGECERRQAEALAAAQARETLERLAERLQADFRRTQARREQRDLDEIALQRHRRLQAAPDALIG